ncbi:MAG: sulfatase-like hydrolase/transferase, partial [Rhodospirillales bacterium]
MKRAPFRPWRFGIEIVKVFSFLLVILGFSPVGSTIAASPLPEAAVKPNVVLILMDDGGVGDIGAYGSKDIRTPNIDALAAQGVRATAGYSAAPMCTPSRAGLMTGRHPQRFGVENNAGPAYPHYGLPLDETTLASALKSIGYIAGAIGKWHLGDDAQFHPNNRGFSYFYGFAKGCCHSYLSISKDQPIQRNGVTVPDPEYTTSGFGADAVNFIRTNQAQPFFLYVAFNAAHEPVQALPADIALYPNLTGIRQTYAAAVSAMDREVGHIVAEVGKLSRPTLIIFLSDNGANTNAGGSNSPF